MSELDGCCILDLEDGAGFVEALKLRVVGLVAPKEDEEKKEARLGEGKYYLNEVGRAIMEAGKPYKYIAIDTITKLEEWCEWYGTELYMKSNIGKNFNKLPTGQLKPRSQWESVLTLANGAGYLWLRIAYKEWIEKLKLLADNVILVGHLKDKLIETKDGKEVSAKDLDLTGKLKNISCADADAIGYLYRDKDSRLHLNFASGEEVTCGARPPHLRGKDIVIGEPNEDKTGLSKVNWDLIYVD